MEVGRGRERLSSSYQAESKQRHRPSLVRAAVGPTGADGRGFERDRDCAKIRSAVIDHSRGKSKNLTHGAAIRRSHRAMSKNTGTRTKLLARVFSSRPGICLPAATS